MDTMNTSAPCGSSESVNDTLSRRFDINVFQAAYTLADLVNASWEETERVDWSEAEQLIELCSAAPIALQSLVPTIRDIIAYANEHEEWDSEYVAGWPSIVIDALEKADKSYAIEENGERWDVVSQYLTGSREWLATVDTHTIADLLVKALSGVPRDKPDNADAHIQKIAVEMTRELQTSTVPLSGQHMDVNIELAIEVRLEYWEEIRVPVEFNTSMLDELIDLAYEQVEASRYSGANCDDWERGVSSHTVIQK